MDITITTRDGTHTISYATVAFLDYFKTTREVTISTTLDTLLLLIDFHTTNTVVALPQTITLELYQLSHQLRYFILERLLEERIVANAPFFAFVTLARVASKCNGEKLYKYLVQYAIEHSKDVIQLCGPEVVDVINKCSSNLFKLEWLLENPTQYVPISITNLLIEINYDLLLTEKLVKKIHKIESSNLIMQLRVLDVYGYLQEHIRTQDISPHLLAYVPSNNADMLPLLGIVLYGEVPLLLELPTVVLRDGYIEATQAYKNAIITLNTYLSTVLHNYIRLAVADVMAVTSKYKESKPMIAQCLICFGVELRYNGAHLNPVIESYI